MEVLKKQQPAIKRHKLNIKMFYLVSKTQMFKYVFELFCYLSI